MSEAIDLSKGKFKKQTIDLKGQKDVDALVFINDIKGQVVRSESGSNIVVTAYGIKEVKYQKVVTTTSSTAEETGKHKNKYKCTTTVYQGEFTEEGELIFNEQGQTSTSYVKQSGSGEPVTTYNMTSANGKKVLVTYTEDEFRNIEPTEIITDKSKVLGTVTYKNGNLSDGAVVPLVSDNGDKSANLLVEIYSPTKKKNKYTGSWLNESVNSTSANETFALETGSDTIVYDMNEKHGNDTVKLVENSTVTLDIFDDENTIWSYSRSGKNVIMTGEQQITPDTYEQVSKITFKNYLKLEQDSVYFKDEEDTLKDKIEDVVYGDKSSTKKQKLTGTFLNETITGGLANDKITTGTGNDVIYASDGNDTLTVDGIGKKIFNFEDYDINDITKNSTTTIGFKKGVDLSDKDKVQLDINYTNEERLRFSKTGDNLTIDKTFDNGVTTYDLYTVIKDFFKEGSDVANVVTVNNDVISDDVMLNNYLYIDGKPKKSNKITDTNYNDYITAGDKSDTITLSKEGNDFVYAKKGNDTIDITSDKGVKTLLFDKESGKDTVINTNSADVIIQNEANYVQDNTGVVSYEKEGNNLIINTFYAKDATNKKSKDITDTITLKEFFASADKEAHYSFTSADEEGKLIYVNFDNILDKDYLKINGVKIKDKQNPLNGKTVFYGSAHNDSMTYSGAGSAYMFGENGADKYDVTITDKSDLTINDTDIYNIINIDDTYENIRIFFNVDRDGKFILKDGDVETDFLWVFNKDAVNIKNIGIDNANTGKMSIEKFFIDNGGNISTCGQYTIYTKDGEDGSYKWLDMDNYIEQVSNASKEWLSIHGEYVTTWDVFEENNKDDVSSMLAEVYQVYRPQNIEPEPEIV